MMLDPFHVIRRPIVTEKGLGRERDPADGGI